jgi:site-specific DNA recombinase
MVAEIKKDKYIYYHCTGHRGKCPEPYVREERLVQQLSAHLQELVVAPKLIRWLQEKYVTSDVTERGARDRMIREHQQQIERIEARIETLYSDRLDGRIAPGFYDAKAGEFRAQQQELLQKIELIRTGAPARIEEALSTIRLIGEAATLFVKQDGPQQGRLLRAVVKAAACRS